MPCRSLLAAAVLALAAACAASPGPGAQNGSGASAPVELPGVDSTSLTAREKN
jgi:hypothetical protein